MAKGFTEKDVPDQSGKVAVVTGANTGLGFHVARVLAEQGAKVFLGCRSKNKAEDAVKRIRNGAPKADVHVLPLDLGDLSSVQAAAATLLLEPRIDLLINNAGIMMPPRELTIDGFESQFGVNHLGPFAFTGLLVDRVMATPGARIVSTSSIAHRRGVIEFDDINAERSYSPAPRYQMSKVANLLFAYELERRLRKTSADTLSVACHPGIAMTDLPRHLPRLLVWILVPILGPFFNSAAQGAWPTLLAATGSGVRGGEYFGPSRRGETAGPAVRVPSVPYSHDEDVAGRLWDLSVELTGVDPGL